MLHTIHEIYQKKHLFKNDNLIHLFLKQIYIFSCLDLYL